MCFFLVFFWSQNRIKHPALSGPSSMKGISNHKQDWFAECCLTRLYTVKPELGKEVESDTELADFIWNGSDALLLMNQTIERTNKAIASTGGTNSNSSIEQNQCFPIIYDMACIVEVSHLL